MVIDCLPFMGHIIELSVRGSPNGTIGNFTIGSQWLTNGTIGLPTVGTNCTIGRVNGAIGITNYHWYHW